MKDLIVKAIEDVAPYAGPHAIPKMRFRPVREALGLTGWGMSVLELDPDCAGYPEHDHADDAHEEVYVVLRGSAVLVTDGKHERTVNEGDLVAVPPGTARKFVTRDRGITLLALGNAADHYQASRGRPTKR